MQTAEKVIYHACVFFNACRYSFAMSTYVATYFYQFLLKSAGLSVVSGLLDVLTDKQGRLIV